MCVEDVPGAGAGWWTQYKWALSVNSERGIFYE